MLGGAIRRTDYLARVSPDGLSAVLVGCKGPDGALAFLGRSERSLERATEDRPAGLQLSYGIQRLADAESTNEALELAEISAARPRLRGATARRSASAPPEGSVMSTDPLLGAPIAGPGSGSPLSGPGVTRAEPERRRQPLPQRHPRGARLRDRDAGGARRSRPPAPRASRRPRRCCSRAARSARTSSPARSPSATGSSTSTWPSSRSTPPPPDFCARPPRSATWPRPSASPTTARSCLRWPIPVTRSASATSR